MVKRRPEKPEPKSTLSTDVEMKKPAHGGLLANTWIAGAAETTRTSDLLITNQLLYQLSYSSEGRRLYGLAPAPAI